MVVNILLDSSHLRTIAHNRQLPSQVSCLWWLCRSKWFADKVPLLESQIKHKLTNQSDQHFLFILFNTNPLFLLEIMHANRFLDLLASKATAQFSVCLEHVCLLFHQYRQLRTYSGSS